MTTRRGGKVLVALSLAMLLSLAVTAGLGLAAEKVLVLGAVNAMSGSGAVYGWPQYLALQLAAADVNAAGGIRVGNDTYRVEFIFYDDKADPTEAVAAARRLIDRDGVQFLLGWATSGSTTPVAHMMGNEDAIMIVGTAAERSITALGHPNVFRTRPPSDYTGGPAGAFVAEQGVRRLAVLGQLKDAIYQQYYEKFKEEFLARGGEIVAEESFSLGDRDMYPQLTRIRGLNADALFVPGYVEQAAFVYRQARELGFDGPIFGFTGGNEEQFLRVTSNEVMEGIWDLRPVELTLEALGPNARAFVDGYVAMHGEMPTPNAPYAYDQVWILKAAIEHAQSLDPQRVMQAMREIPVPEGVVLNYVPINGKLFDQNGQAYITNIAMQWQNGRWVYVAELPSGVEAYSAFLSSLRP